MADLWPARKRASPKEHLAECVRRWEELSYSGLWLAADEGMQKKMETTVMGYIRTTIRIDSFTPS